MNKIRFHELQQLNRSALIHRASASTSMGLQGQFLGGGFREQGLSAPLVGLNGSTGLRGTLGSLHHGGDFQPSSYQQVLSNQRGIAPELSSQYNDLSLTPMEQLRQKQLLSNYSAPMQ